MPGKGVDVIGPDVCLALLVDLFGEGLGVDSFLPLLLEVLPLALFGVVKDAPNKVAVGFEVFELLGLLRGVEEVEGSEEGGVSP